MAVHRTHRRFVWIADRYDTEVVRACLSALLEAAGIHERAFCKPGDELEHVQRALPRYTRFNRYLPWLAQQLHELNQLRKIQILHQAAQNSRGHGVLSIRGILASAVLGLMTYRMLANPRARHALQTFEELTLRFRSVADWAAAKRIDISRYQARAALDEASRWRTKRAMDDMPRGDVVLELEGDWTMQRLRSAAELEAEGAAMQHCLDQNAVDSVGEIYSLRDPKGLPHATMEWLPDQARVLQVRGKQNVRPRTDYLFQCAKLRLTLQPSDAFSLAKPPDCARQFDNAHQKYLGCWRAKPDLVAHLDDALGLDWCVYFVWRPMVLGDELAWLPMARTVPSNALPGLAAFAERAGTEPKIGGTFSKALAFESRAPTGFSWHVLVEHGAFLEREAGGAVVFMGQNLVDDHLVSSLFNAVAKERCLRDVLDVVGCAETREPPFPGNGHLHVDRRQVDDSRRKR